MGTPLAGLLRVENVLRTLFPAATINMGHVFRQLLLGQCAETLEAF
jgi:hypothetical protein